jgi:outer membrane protein assembly factor BamD
MVALVLTACSSNSEREAKKSSAEQLFEQARHSMASGNYRYAIEYYENLGARFPFSNQTRQAQLDLIYCYYKNGERESAIDAATQFERENPTHPRVDYALYMRGLASFRGQRGYFHRLLRIDLTRRPPEGARESFSAFAQLLQRYPNSAYAADARQRMIFLRNHLAVHENHVARYYLDRGAYLAAINRAKFTVQSYDGSPAVAESMRIMIDSYRALGMNDLADSTRTVLAANFPEAAIEQIRTEEKPWYALGWFGDDEAGQAAQVEQIEDQTRTGAVEQTGAGKKPWYALGWFGGDKASPAEPAKAREVEQVEEQPRTDSAEQTEARKKHWYSLGWFGQGKTGEVGQTAQAEQTEQAEQAEESEPEQTKQAEETKARQPEQAGESGKKPWYRLW